MHVAALAIVTSSQSEPFAVYIVNCQGSRYYFNTTTILVGRQQSSKSQAEERISVFDHETPRELKGMKP